MYDPGMEWLNYHHLLYFWVVAREGSISRACAQLRLRQPTISGQLRALEDAIGDKLFLRAGRSLILTDTGRTVFGYADQIFTLGRELTDVLRGRPAGRPTRVLVGITDGTPKLIAYRLLQPVLAMGRPVQLVCRESAPERLFAELLTHGLDIVLADAPVRPQVKIRAFSHLLGECGVAIFGTRALAARYRKKFPSSLNGAPFLLPTENAVLRRSLEAWFDRNHVKPAVSGEFDDSALMKVFGEGGAGLFAVQSVIAKEVARQYGVAMVGQTDIREHFYAISIERKLRDPAVVALFEGARQTLFTDGARPATG
jgi:LysR family transcriptional regulator, transcriptional activator of nhaA